MAITFGSGSSSDYESGDEKMPTSGKIFLAIVGVIILGLLTYFYGGDLYNALK